MSKSNTKIAANTIAVASTLLYSETDTRKSRVNLSTRNSHV